jgi:hypothetical protein
MVRARTIHAGGCLDASAQTRQRSFAGQPFAQ